MIYSTLILKGKYQKNDSIFRAERSLNIEPEQWHDMDTRMSIVVTTLGYSDELYSRAYEIEQIHDRYYDEKEPLNVYGELQGEWKDRVWNNTILECMESMNSSSLRAFQDLYNGLHEQRRSM